MLNVDYSRPAPQRENDGCEPDPDDDLCPCGASRHLRWTSCVPCAGRGRVGDARCRACDGLGGRYECPQHVKEAA